MKKRLIEGIFVMFLLALSLALLPEASADSGCCCNVTEGISYNSLNSTIDRQNCPSGFQLITPPNRTVGCLEVCQQASEIPPPPLTPTQCGALGYQIPPKDFQAIPVKGKKEIKLSWNIDCPVNYYSISRCKGTGCTDFQLINQISPSIFFIDDDESLLWDTIYTYNVTAHYPLSDSNAAIDSTTTGDIECSGQFGTGQFCVSKPYYRQFEDYLKANGYKATPLGSFTATFDTAVQNTFFQNFNKAFICDSSNQISSSQVICTNAEVCVAQDGVASCVEKSLCSNASSGYFGLYYDVQTCEGTSSKPQFCFLDRSPTTVDNCYKCDLMMECYDYRSKGSCERDNCGVGNCEWEDVFPGLGIGVCVDKNYENCHLCTERGNNFMENYNAYNEVFDQCSQEKSDALSTTEFPCFWQNWVSYGCDSISCRDYTQTTCGSPSGGVQLYANHSIRVRSTDPCQIAVCQWDTTQRCHKNADGDFAKIDCDPLRPDRESCELDYFPPKTTLISGGEAGRTDYIFIQILDKIRKVDAYKPISAGKGYTTFLCIWPDNRTECTDFDINTTNSLLTLNDGKLQDGQTVIKELSFGKNHIKYYSVDPNGNLGIVRIATIGVCDNCQGPFVISSDMRAARKKNNIYYTSITKPIMDVIFNEPIFLTYNKVEQNNTLFDTQFEAASGNMNFSFFPVSDLAEGNYLFRLNGKDDGDILMSNDLVMNFVVDQTPPTVGFIINGKQQSYILLNVSTAQVELNFSEFSVLRNVTITDFYGTVDATSQFITSTDELFLGNFVVNDGANTIRVEAEDFAGNIMTDEYTFYVNARPPIIHIIEPSYGVSADWEFDLAFETLNNVTCRFWYDYGTSSHNLPPPPTFLSLLQFEQTGGQLHTFSDFDGIPLNDTKEYPLYVKCTDDLWGFGDETFMIHVDNTPPEIITAYAHPDIIKESPFETILKVQTDDNSFCKYSPTISSYLAMEDTFPNFHTWRFSKVHAQKIIVPEQKNYIYKIACENLAGLISETADIKFGVNTSYPFKITSHTKPFYNSTQVLLAVESNKRAYCYYGSSAATITNCFGTCERGYSHLQSISVPREGRYTYYARCNTGAEISEISEVLAMTFIVDMTEPIMLYVNDSSNLPEQPEISYFKDKIRVSWLGEDNETPVNRYFYKLGSIFGTEVINWTLTNKGKDGDPFMISKDHTGRSLNLSEQVTYKFTVMPVNSVDLIGESMESDGVTIDSTKMPAACSNGIKDAGETGIDCGGICPPCAAGAACESDVDCDSGFCVEGVCAAATCTDGAQNGDETGVDCGGPCPPCAIGASCLTDEDCGTGNCEGGVCVSADACSDGMLTGTESDVDCGGACPTKCGEGKSCNIESDCIAGARCIGGLCTVCDIDDFDCDGIENCRDPDIDNDGLKNWEDPDDDNDGINDQIDPDDDNDGVPDPEDKDCDNDLDNDGIINEKDDDIDGDGLLNDEDPDDDNDGLNDDIDSDDDNDGILDIDEDDDGDGLPNGWELRHGLDPNDPSDAVTDRDEDGLTALEEFQFDRRLDPNNRDTDGDGWSDKKEIDRGFDPLDPNSHPTSLLWWILILFIIIMLLIVFGYGGYEYYQKIIVPKREEKKRKEKAVAAPKALPKKGPPAKKLTPAEKKKLEVKLRKEKAISVKFDKLRQLIPGAKPAKPPAKKEWEALPEVEEELLEKEIAKKLKKKPKVAFERLKKLKKDKLPKKERYKALDRLKRLTGKKVKVRREPEVDVEKIFKELRALKRRITAEKIIIPAGPPILRKLSKVALEQMSPKEAAEFLRKLKLLRAGKLTKAEIAALFKKLREIAAYYKTHMEELGVKPRKKSHKKRKKK